MEGNEANQAELLAKAVGSGEPGTWGQLGLRFSMMSSDSPEKQAFLAGVQAGMGEPSQKTRNNLWYIAVASMAFVMVAAVVALAIGVFLNAPATPVVRSDLLLSVFTAALGFLAGVFVPSPAQK